VAANIWDLSARVQKTSVAAKQSVKMTITASLQFSLVTKWSTMTGMSMRTVAAKVAKAVPNENIDSAVA